MIAVLKSGGWLLALSCCGKSSDGHVLGACQEIAFRQSVHQDASILLYSEMMSSRNLVSRKSGVIEGNGLDLRIAEPGSNTTEVRLLQVGRTQ
jgi:hypothetical protein